MKEKRTRNVYKYQWDQCDKQIYICYIDHFISFVVICSTQFSLHTVREQSNWYNKTQALFIESSLMSIMYTPPIKNQLPFKDEMSTVQDKNQSLDDLSNSTSKPILLSTTILTLELSSSSALVLCGLMPTKTCQ